MSLTMLGEYFKSNNAAPSLLRERQGFADREGSFKFKSHFVNFHNKKN